MARLAGANPVRVHQYRVSDMNILDCVANWLDRRELKSLRHTLKNLRETEAERFSHLSYLESRDKLCSSMANIINNQAFEIAKLKGIYTNISDGNHEIKNTPTPKGEDQGTL